MVSHSFSPRQVTALFGFLLLVGCNYQQEKAAEESNENLQGAEVNFKSVQENVFMPLCQTCHTQRGVFTFEDPNVVSSKLLAIENRVFVQQDMPPAGIRDGRIKALLREWINQGGPL